MSSDSPASADVDRICPRCGTDSGGAPWCPKCGLNLRRPSSGESPPAAGSPPGTEPSQPEDYSLTQVMAAQTASSRRKRVAGSGLVAVIAVVGALALVVLGIHGTVTPKTLLRKVGLSKSGLKHPRLKLPSGTGTTGTTAGATGNGGTTGGGTGGTSPAITAAAMKLLLTRYALAYSSESVPALKSLFAVNLVRKNGKGPAENLSQALATYRSQFAQLTHPKYSLTQVTFTPGQAAATGAYSIKSAAGSAGGSITYHFVRKGNKLLIDRMVIQPS